MSMLKVQQRTRQHNSYDKQYRIALIVGPYLFLFLVVAECFGEIRLFNQHKEKISKVIFNCQHDVL